MESRMADSVHAASFAELLDLLLEAYGPPRRSRRLPPVDELVLTILSQNTSDTNTDRAYASLRERFASWHDVAAADPADVVDAIRSGGLANQKGPRIQAVLRELLSSNDGLDLGSLGDLDPQEAIGRLTALPGVGKKTASCVLLFSLDGPVMPVDTHILRIARRLGLVGERASADETHALLTSLTPPDRMLEAHLLLIQHGRETCRARRPLCEACPLLPHCPTGRQRVAVM
ncbi:MAG: endonuclease [Gaiellales bacterium]|jgi:endonuclease-3|nr:endonuclease [Gaiellales bacterium]